MEEYITLHNKRLTPSDLEFIRGLIESEGYRGRTFISKRLCEIWNWRTPNGQLRDITAREVLRKLENHGLVVLPPLLCAGRRVGYKNKTKLTEPLDTTVISCPLSTLSLPSIEMVRGTKKEKLYNALIDRYHYLGYQQGSGEQLKYLVKIGEKVVGCVGFGSSAFKISPRDTFIGWSHQTRKRNLVQIVNNNRFLILPWVQVKNLASYILGSIARRIQRDWFGYYCREIVLLETFVETRRFLGTCYKAANWLYLGQTTGRGRNDRHTERLLPVKDIYVYPLCKDFRERLQAEEGAQR
jgi:hypothetical protein